MVFEEARHLKCNDMHGECITRQRIRPAWPPRNDKLAINRAKAVRSTIAKCHLLCTMVQGTSIQLDELRKKCNTISYRVV
jgi:hypothetical protein